MNAFIGILGDQSPRQDSGSRIRARILGTLQICRGDEVLECGQLGGPRARQILEILLLHLGVPVSKSLLIDMLWNGAAPAAAVSTLESYVSVLRRRLQPGQGKSGPLKTTNGGYLLDHEAIDLDLTQFESLLRQAERSQAPVAYELLRTVLQMAEHPLLGSELLPEWAESARIVHETRVVSARVLAAQTALKLGRYAEAMALAQRLLSTNALNDQAWTCLILGWELSGNPLQGLQAFDDCRQIMDRELGCRPGPVLSSIHERLLYQTSAEPDDFGQVLGALLAIRGTLSGADSSNGIRVGGDLTGPAARFKEAGAVISGYLNRAAQIVC